MAGTAGNGQGGEGAMEEPSLRAAGRQGRCLFKAEDADDRPAGFDCGAQRRVVGNPKVPAKPDNGGGFALGWPIRANAPDGCGPAGRAAVV